MLGIAPRLIEIQDPDLPNSPRPFHKEKKRLLFRHVLGALLMSFPSVEYLSLRLEEEAITSRYQLQLFKAG